MEKERKTPEDKNDREKVILHFKISGLKGPNSEEKPSCYIILAEKFDNVITEIGRTEVQEWQENPDFEQTFVVDFVFERKQRLKAQIVFVESTRKRPVKEGMASKLSNQEGTKTGYVDFYLHALFNQKKLNINFDIIPNDDQTIQGSVNVKLQKYSIFPYKFSFNLKGKNMTNFGLRNNITPTIYMLKPVLTPDQRNLIISGKKTFNDIEVTKWKKVAERLGKGSEYNFQKIKSDSWRFLSCGSLESPICIQLYNTKKNNLKLKGQKTVKFLDIAQEGGNYFQLICPKRKKSAGVVFTSDFEFERIYSFSDFLQSGLDISVAACIDFTKSNLEATNPESLHWMCPEPKSKNPYQKIIRAICSSLLHYDSDGKIHGYGFGAKPKSGGEVQHAFALTLGEEETVASGYEEFWEKYKNTIGEIEFCSETKLAPIVGKMIEFCSENSNKSMNNYMVATILTNGDYEDQEELINNLVKSSMFPMSIIFFGVGDKKFNDLQIFNGKFKNKEGQTPERANTKFVRFDDFIGKKGSELTAAFMGELPSQIVSYYKMIGKEPHLEDEASKKVSKWANYGKKPEEQENKPEDKEVKEEIEEKKTEEPVEETQDTIEEKVVEGPEKPPVEEPEIKEEVVEEAETPVLIVKETEDEEKTVQPKKKPVKAEKFKEGDDVVVGNDSDYEEVEIEVEVTDSEGDEEYEYVEVEVEVTDSEGEEEGEEKKEGEAKKEE